MLLAQFVLETKEYVTYVVFHSFSSQMLESPPYVLRQQCSAHTFIIRSILVTIDFVVIAILYYCIQTFVVCFVIGIVVFLLVPLFPLLILIVQTPIINQVLRYIFHPVFV